MVMVTAETDQHSHVFRPGLFHRPRVLRLEGAVLHWQVGSQSHAVPLADIAAMRLNLATGTDGAARCVLIERSGRKHEFSDRYWSQRQKGKRRHWGHLQLRNESFRTLAFPLARKLAATNPQARITTGPSRIEWIASCLVAMLAVMVIIGGIGLMLVQRRFPLTPIAFIGMVAAYLPMLWPVIRSGGPQPLDPAALGDAGS